MLAPIPPSLLPSTVAVSVPIDGDFGGEYAPPVTIEGVRFEPSETLVRSAAVLSDGAKGLLFVDAVNSKGAFGIPVGSLLELEGETGTAAAVTACKGFGGEVHHWEIEVR